MSCLAGAGSAYIRWEFLGEGSGKGPSCKKGPPWKLRLKLPRFEAAFMACIRADRPSAWRTRSAPCNLFLQLPFPHERHVL